MKKRFIVMFSVCLMLIPAAVSFADLAEDITKLVGDNATSYIHPITNSIGIGMNSGWCNSSKSYSFFKIPVGLQVYFGWPITMVNDDLREYDFKGSVATSNLITQLGLPAAVQTLIGGKDSLHIAKPGAPTMVGEKTGSEITFFELLGTNGIDTSNIAMQALPEATKRQVVLELPGGLGADIPALPSVPAIGVNLGLPFKVQAGLRFMPPVKVPDFGEISQFGFKLQYEFTQWIPVVKDLPLIHTSAFYAMNNANFFDLLTLKNWTTMINASADFKFLIGLGVYGGIGLEGSTMELDYTVPDEVVGLGGTKVSLEDKGDNFFKAQVGLRLSLLAFDIMADATFGNTQAYFLGVGIGLNGL